MASFSNHRYWWCHCKQAKLIRKLKVGPDHTSAPGFMESGRLGGQVVPVPNTTGRLLKKTTRNNEIINLHKLSISQIVATISPARKKN